MPRHKRDPATIDACAAAHGVSKEAVRVWRRAKDPRWLEFTATSTSKPADVMCNPDRGLGLRHEVTRLAKECEALALREYAEREANICDKCGRAGRIDVERTLGAMLNEKRVTLHKLAKDTVGIEAEAGDVVKRTVMVQYAARIVALVRTLPARLASIVPDSVGATVRQRTQAEVDNLCELAAEIQPED